MLTHDEKLKHKDKLLEAFHSATESDQTQLRFQLKAAYVDLAGDAEIPSLPFLEAQLRRDGVEEAVSAADIRTEWRKYHRVRSSIAYRLWETFPDTSRPTEASLQTALDIKIREVEEIKIGGNDADSQHHNAELDQYIGQLHQLRLEQVVDVWEFCFRNGIAPFKEDDSAYKVH